MTVLCPAPCINGTKTGKSATKLPAESTTKAGSMRLTSAKTSITANEMR